MLTNSQMVAGRFLKISRARKIMSRANACWDAGGTVRISAYASAADIRPKARDLIVMTAAGSLFMKRGKRLDCLSGCGFSFSA